MQALVNLEILVELYPDPAGRTKFVRRAQARLHLDCLALQDALAAHAYALAQQLMHRLLGTAAFLMGSREHPARIFHPLSEALQRNDAARTRAAKANVLQYLLQLENALSNAIYPDLAFPDAA
jgi:hypothetical protein